MLTDVVRIDREDDKYVVFNKRGMVLELTIEEYKLLMKWGRQRAFPKVHKDFFNRLCSYEITLFENYEPKREPVQYSMQLLNHTSSSPVFRAPIVAHLGITGLCNMRCKYCSVRKPYLNTDTLTTKEWKTIITKLRQLGVYQIGLTGGEPTLREDIVELAKYVTKQGCSFNLTTNGWQIDKRLILRLKSAGMGQCQVSLDSNILKINDMLRENGSCVRATSTIRLMKELGIVVGIDCVVSKNNIRHIESFVKWLKEQEVPYLTLIKIKQGYLSKKDFQELLPDYWEYTRLIEKMCNRKNISPCVTIDCGSVSNLQAVLREDELNKVPVAGCPAGHTLLSIAPNGDIYPCVALSDPEFKIGNALRDDLKEVFNENKVLRKLREVKQRVTGECFDCKRLDYCRAGCRGIANSLYGLWESDKTCEVKKCTQEQTSS
ncbi:MAG: radical SAM protein [Candidatus Woesearchaeota archaeon]